MRPGQGGDVILELQDRQKGVTPDRLDPESGSGEYLAVFQFDPVVDREPQPSSEQQVEEASARRGG